MYWCIGGLCPNAELDVALCTQNVAKVTFRSSIYGERLDLIKPWFSPVLCGGWEELQGMKGLHSLSIVVILSTTGSPTLRGQGTNLPRPDSSRAPRITSLSADSVRLQVQSLYLMQLLQNVQQGDSSGMDQDLAAVSWGPTDGAARLHPQCRTLGVAVANLARSASAAPAGGASPHIFFDKIRLLKDSVPISSVRVTLITNSKRTTEIIQIVHDSTTLAISRMDGFLAAVCAAAGVL